MIDLNYNKTTSVNDTSQENEFGSEKGLNALKYAVAVTAFTSDNVTVIIQTSLDKVNWVDQETLLFTGAETQRGSVKDVAGYARFSIEATDSVSIEAVAVAYDGSGTGASVGSDGGVPTSLIRGLSHETSSVETVAIIANIAPAITTATTTLVVTATKGRVPIGFDIEGGTFGVEVTIHAAITAINPIKTVNVAAGETLRNAFEGCGFVTGLVVVTVATGTLLVTPAYI